MESSVCVKIHKSGLHWWLKNKEYKLFKTTNLKIILIVTNLDCLSALLHKMMSITRENALECETIQKR